MRGRSVASLAAVVALLAAPAIAGAHDEDGAEFEVAPASAVRGEAFSTFDYTQNLHPMGFSERTGTINSDLAFWGDRAYQGNYVGFRILDISSPAQPRELVNYDDCQGNQGDVIVWGDILVRSWNSSAPAGATCDGEPVPQGFEGLHVFDVSDPANPERIADVDLACGSHTATGVPDPANDRLLVYNSSSSGACPGIDIVEVPLGAPGDAALLRSEPSGRSCHDTGVILGEAMLAACAGGNGFTVWSLGGAGGGSLEDPQQLYTKQVPTVTIGHSAAFSFDGETLVFGHEPGGGTQARCEATDPESERSFFFFEARSGAALGTWVLPRTQSNTENCTLHNYNVVPTERGDVLVHGSYQSGIGVLDFSDPTNAVEVAYADPAPLSATTLITGGDWSSYWYNGEIYESDITRGLMTWKLSSSAVAGARKLDHLNPQTQEFTID